MADKNLEELAKKLGYENFRMMKESLGNKGASFSFGSLFQKKKDEKSPTKAGGETEGSISADVIPFLNIIAKNSLALPGMARDMNVLRQNIVKLVKFKNAEAITKADKFFKTEDKREAELEEARKKETAPKQVDKEGKPKKEKEDTGGEEGVVGYLWDLLKKVLATLFLGLALAFSSAFDLGKIISGIAEKLNPLPLIEDLFKSIEEGWKAITETDIVKETLIKGVGKFLDFITAGLFGEKELRKSLDDLSEYISPMIDVIGETFQKIVGWLKDNIGWDPFTIPLSKINDLPIVGDLLKKIGWGFSDVQVPGFRPFKKTADEVAPAPTGGATPIAPPKEDLGKAKTAQGEIVTDQQGVVVSGGMATSPTPDKGAKGSASKESLATKAETSKESAVEFLRKKVGVQVDPKSPTGFSRVKTNYPVSVEAVRQDIADEGGNPDKILAALKAAATPTAVAPTTQTATPPAATAGGGTPPASSISAAASPSAETAATPKTSGASLSQASSDVAEGQRMDAAADAGIVVDAGTVNNNMGTTSNKSKQTADAFNTSFIDSYYSNRTAAA
jgi:hypothetical protein